MVQRTTAFFRKSKKTGCTETDGASLVSRLYARHSSQRKIFLG
jgi:hypothetical protein